VDGESDMTKPLVIIGAGPYGLATGAFARHAGVQPQLFGEVMGFWHHMPDGMFLRSYFRASNIADPEQALTLTRFEEAIGRRLDRPIPLADFIAYGEWFAEQAKLDVDPRKVRRVSRDGDTFALTLDDGSTIDAERVVVATGITPFPWRPPLFSELAPGLVSHTSEHHSYDEFAGKQVAVVGAGQSALEAAAFLKRAGASPEVFVRGAGLRFLKGERLYESAGPLGNFLYPAWGVGPPGINWIMGRPSIFRLLPPRLAAPLARRAIKPAGAAWLHPMLEGIPITTGREIRAAVPENGRVRLELTDGGERVVDHVVLGTGYRLDVRRYDFLDPSLVERVRLRVDGYPRLSGSFESSVPGLYFVGAPAAASAGPGMRFVSHTDFVARAIAASLRRRAA
jgi:hypothetical protein